MVLLFLAACLVNDDLYALRLAALRDDDGDGYGASDCDDQDPARHPDALEACDGEDDDCDGLIDEEGVGTFWYIDLDKDGYGNPQGYTEACVAPGADWVAQGEDCDDGDARNFPGAPERCDGADNNCNQSIDEEAVDPPTWYLDGDDDGFGASDVTLSVCVAPAGYVEEGGDCDDSDASAWPGAPEQCDGADNDCDGSADEPPIAAGGGAWVPDEDGDGFGDAAGSAETRCEGGDGLVDNALDCDDADVGVNPGATEVCGDGVDNDCDGGPNDCAWPAEVDLTHGGSIVGEDDYGWYGEAATLVDLDGDGVSELFVGGTGVVEPVSGKALGAIDQFRAISSTARGRSSAAATVWGETEYELSALAGCDVDGDGFADLLSGNLGYEDTGLMATGEVRVWRGPQVFSTGHAHEVVDATLVGDSNMLGLGAHLACVSGLDGGSLRAVVAYGLNSVVGPAGRGGVSVIGLPPSGSSMYSDSVKVEIVPSVALDTGGHFGGNVVSSDQNGDGFADLTVTADEAYSGVGGAYTFYGPLSGEFTEEDADVQFYSEGGGLFGGGAAVIGDANGDGLEDIAISASQYMDGAVYIFWTDSAATTILAADAPVKIRADVRPGFGYFVHALGDINLDGEADLGVAEMYYPSSDATIFYGPFDTRGVITSSAADVHLKGDGSTDYLYSVMSNIGDWNGDGAPELMVSSTEHTDRDELSGIVYFLPGVGW